MTIADAVVGRSRGGFLSSSSRPLDGRIDWSSGSYEFDLTVVLKRESDGQLFYAEDSGCSCPTPFENHTLHDLTACTPAELQAHLVSRNGSCYDNRDAEIAELMSRIVS